MCLIYYLRAKYPLAVVAKLLCVFGKDLGGGFDIGCRFKTTLSQSPLGPQAEELNYTSLVGGFHGHAHRRLCQLAHLATYIKGLGLEDLEGCERAFSKSNDVAPAVRYASVFHRMQAIATYFKYNDDMEVYQNLSK
jgi:Kyakuja-Dileera-Zisupton transposase